MSKRRILGFETQQQPLLGRAAFFRRLVASFVTATMLIGLSLFAGMAGYHYFEGMPWIDAFANASMILSGMGPLAPLHTSAGKVFAGLYALYSGLALVIAFGVFLGPIVHRVLHKFHLDGEDSG